MFAKARRTQVAQATFRDFFHLLSSAKGTLMELADAPQPPRQHLGLPQIHRSEAHLRGVLSRRLRRVDQRGGDHFASVWRSKRDTKKLPYPRHSMGLPYMPLYAYIDPSNHPAIWHTWRRMDTGCRGTSSFSLVHSQVNLPGRKPWFVGLLDGVKHSPGEFPRVKST